MIPLIIAIAANGVCPNLRVVFLFTFGAFIFAEYASFWGHAFAVEAKTLHFRKVTVSSAKLAGIRTDCKITTKLKYFFLPCSTSTFIKFLWLFWRKIGPGLLMYLNTTESSLYSSSGSG